jgi:tRNA A37 threonylcarbamoyladenosine dehydratase
LRAAIAQVRRAASAEFDNGASIGLPRKMQQTVEEQKFAATRRLYGEAGFQRIRRAHICVVGLGGVGSWTVEALARTGVGALTLIDLDEICLSNINRQVHALEPTVGQFKATALAERIALIAADCAVTQHLSFLTPSSVDTLLQASFDYVVDAIDVTRHKACLIAACKAKSLPVVTCSGAGGRTDPTRIRICDLAQTRDDPLAAQVRRLLRREYGFPRGEKRRFKVPCVCSDEPLRFPQTDGSVCAQREKGANYRLNCDSGFGSAATVTGAFGFALAAHVLAQLTESTP